MFKSINGGKLPTKATKYSAGLDVYANEDVVINAGETVVIPLGIKIDHDNYTTSQDNFKKSHYLQLMLRSSLGTGGLILPNGVEIINLDCLDELKMIIHNPIQSVDHHEIHTEAKDWTHSYMMPCRIEKGDRIGQIILLEHKNYLIGVESEAERKGSTNV